MSADLTLPSTADAHAGSPPAVAVVAEPSAERGWPRHLRGGRLYAWLTVACLALAALSLLFPSTPSYDPWAWLVWGREILHGTLHTPGGPTWKPLPVIFTTVLALFGSAQPNLWLVVARAGAALSVLMAFVVAARITWMLRGTGPSNARGATVSRVTPYLPAALAGTIALISFALTGEYLSASTLGYSEGLMVAATLIAVDRHMDGHYRMAFAFGFIAALDRPEVWLFWGPYGLWLMWRDPGARALVIGLALLTLFLWFVPQKWGGGSFTSGVTRAQHPRANSPAFAHCPFCAELEDHAWPLVLLRVKVVAFLAVLAGILVLWRRRSLELVRGRSRGLLLIVVTGVFGLAWWVLVALETQAGFSGNDRYLVLGSAFIVITGAVGFGWLAEWLSEFVRARPHAQAWARPRPRASLAPAGTAFAALVYLLMPGWVGGNLISIPKTHRSLLYQAHLRSDLVSLIGHHGGPKAVLGCGRVMTEGFQVPMVAWYLDVRTLRVADEPPTNSHGLAPVPRGQWPATIFQDRDTRNSALLPLTRTIDGWEHEGARYRFTPGPSQEMFMFEDCRAHPARSA